MADLKGPTNPSLIIEEEKPNFAKMPPDPDWEALLRAYNPKTASFEYDAPPDPDDLEKWKGNGAEF